MINSTWSLNSQTNWTSVQQHYPLRIHSSCKETSDFEEVALFTNQEGLNSHEELFKNKFRDFGNRVLKVASVPVITHINLLILSFLNIENNKKISFFTKKIIGYRLNYIFEKFWKYILIANRRLIENILKYN